MEKFLFCGRPTLMSSHLFSKLAGSNDKNYWSHASQVKRKVNCGKLSLEFNSVRIATHKERPALKHGQIHVEKVNSTLPAYAVFSTRTQWSLMPSENFALSSINKDQLEDLLNYLNQKMIATINIADGSTLGDNLVTSHQIDHMSSVLIQSFQLKSLKMTKNTLHLLAIRQVVSRHYFSHSLCREAVIMSNC